MTFILRLSVDATGRVSGVVHRVRSGAKERFYGLEALGPLVARMVADETCVEKGEAPGAGEGVQRLPDEEGAE